ncbi:hypothetical protein SpAn4DRAFT_1838 [Sporomusa ovata]|uniref:Uncharacterized protein n=1 Tax=Sporomusa ovata TaxID=2378 RepID=A0A0U1KTU2_9FIRM|nr:hypothetical protein SpAn4DRAFT_1838 [Sporomusa ovata]
MIILLFGNRVNIKYKDCITKVKKELSCLSGTLSGQKG